MTNTSDSRRWTYRPDVTPRTEGLTGYQVEATDGTIGKIDEASDAVGASYIVVDTGFWIFGKKRLIPAGVVTSVDHFREVAKVNITKDEIKSAPDFEASQNFHDEAWQSDYDHYDRYLD